MYLYSTDGVCILAMYEIVVGRDGELGHGESLIRRYPDTGSCD